MSTLFPSSGPLHPEPFDSDDLLRWRLCARRFWLQHELAHDVAPARADPSAEAAVVHGPALGDALRGAYPGALRIGTAVPWPQALAQTAQWLARPWQPDATLLGACLASRDGARARIDVLQRGEEGLRLFKVRYATVADEADIDAVAWWTHVAAHRGLSVQSAGLLLVDTDFIYPGHGCYAGMFREVELGPVLDVRPIDAWLQEMRHCARGAAPRAEPGPRCTRHGRCPFIEGCQVVVPAADANPARLEIVGRERAAELHAEGHADLHSVPESRLVEARHRRALRAVQRGAAVIEPEVGALLRQLPYPRCALRIDTIGFAVPVWSGTRPYQVLPFQWSLDVEAAPGELRSIGFLAGPQGDPRREFARSLLQALGTHGPVFAYNAGFERNRIRELAQRFDDLAPALTALLPRIVDLFQMARAHFYHPAMCGSWSFRSVFNAVAPELRADEFDFEGESSTQAAFARTLQRGLDDDTRLALRLALTTHGQRQTAALRRLVALFEGAAPG